MEELVHVSLASTLSMNQQPIQFPDCRIGTSRHTYPNLQDIEENNTYWYIVLNLKDLSVPLSEITRDYHAAPDALKPYMGDREHLLVLITHLVFSSHMVQGDFFDLLVKVGAGKKLRQMEQLFSQMGTGIIPQFSYILAATTASADESGFEAFDVTDPVFMTFDLLWNDRLGMYLPTNGPR